MTILLCTCSSLAWSLEFLSSIHLEIPSSFSANNLLLLLSSYKWQSENNAAFNEIPKLNSTALHNKAHFTKLRIRTWRTNALACGLYMLSVMCYYIGMEELKQAKWAFRVSSCACWVVEQTFPHNILPAKKARRGGTSSWSFVNYEKGCQNKKLFS